MSPIPMFDARGFLPPYMGDDGTTEDRSPYDASMTEIVSSLGTSAARRKLLSGLLDYRELLGRLGYDDGLQFLDGSFVENVEIRENRDPIDIDVFSFLVRPTHFKQDPALWASKGFAEWSSEIADQARNKQRFGLDTYAAAIDQCGPLGVIIFTVYWYSLFAHKRVTHDWKGFLRVQLNPIDDAAARVLLVKDNA